MIDLYSVKPIDGETLRAAAEATGGRVVTVEDHWPRAASATRCSRRSPTARRLCAWFALAVREMPGSGKPAELLAAAGIDAEPHRRGRASALVGSPVAASS